MAILSVFDLSGQLGRWSDHSLLGSEIGSDHSLIKVWTMV